MAYKPGDDVMRTQREFKQRQKTNKAKKFTSAWKPTRLDIALAQHGLLPGQSTIQQRRGR